MTEKIEQMMSQMTDAEIRERLAEYMERDVTLRPPLIAVEVRMKPTYDASCRYDGGGRNPRAVPRSLLTAPLHLHPPQPQRLPTPPGCGQQL